MGRNQVSREFSEGFRQELWDLAVSKAETEADYFEKLCQSPIEVDFAVAFVMAIKLFRTSPIITIPPGAAADMEGRYYYLKPQAQIGRHRVDFIVGISTILDEAIVECDGREFHHSTREQIERDRERDKDLEGAGYKVFRFPGTQIHNSPFGCVADVLVWLGRAESKA